MSRFVVPVLFKNDERGYRRWTRAHPDGFVLNVDSADFGSWRGKFSWPPVLHLASCRYVSGKPPNGNDWTVAYAKVCCDEFDVLVAVATANDADARPCKVCRPDAVAVVA